MLPPSLGILPFLPVREIVAIMFLTIETTLPPLRNSIQELDELCVCNFVLVYPKIAQRGLVSRRFVIEHTGPIYLESGL
jgi:hypothetical protein